jgi:hypothetical protein
MVSDTQARVRALVADGKVRVSDHGYDELVDDDILVIEVLDGIQSAIWWRITPGSGKDRASLCFSRMPPADLYMSFGACRRAAQNRPLW